MGQLLYGSPATAFEVDDRALAHLQVVIVNKFRRNETFVMSLDLDPSSGAAREGMWMHPAIQIRFQFAEVERPSVSRTWCEALMSEANGPRGLSLIAEPDAAVSGSPASSPRRVAA